MPTFLSDPPAAVYLALAVAVLIAGAVWFNRRDRRSLAVFLGVVGVAALVFLVDALFESPREEAVRRVQAMMKAADEKKPDDFVANLADRIEYQGAGGVVTLTREQVRTHALWNLLRGYNVHVAAWDFARSDVKEGENSVEVGFLAKGEAQGTPVPFYFRATLTRQPDGQYKLTRLASFDALKRQNERVSIPNFP